MHQVLFSSQLHAATLAAAVVLNAVVQPVGQRRHSPLPVLGLYQPWAHATALPRSIVKPERAVHECAALCRLLV